MTSRKKKRGLDWKIGCRARRSFNFLYYLPLLRGAMSDCCAASQRNVYYARPPPLPFRPHAPTRAPAPPPRDRPAHSEELASHLSQVFMNK